MINRAMELDASPETFEVRGSIYVATGELQQGLDDFNEALRLAQQEDWSQQTALIVELHHRRALVTILDERPTDRPAETALLSEAALAEDWESAEEDEAWKHLQEVR